MECNQPISFAEFQAPKPKHLSPEAPAWRERRGELAGLPTALSPSTVQTSEGSSTERVTALKAEQALRSGYEKEAAPS